MAMGLEEGWKGRRLTKREAAMVEYVEEMSEGRLEQGLGDPHTLSNFLWSKSRSLVFLSKTKLAVVEMATIKHRIGEFDGVFQFTGTGWRVDSALARNVKHLDEKLSDHLLIMLKLNDVHRAFDQWRRRFKFENIWATEEGCRRVVEEAWAVEAVGGSWDILQARLQV
ncbi:hypothetical protein Cgig2_020917 [Carnegiea gigantea]|uniref:Uncharacterized protein n=1 Tax=Carnegiea gigantea TaxID=171969 RepID=A0A9Q1JJU7_9CARY|nr:hypothetical protein Cgig2_020917 [Carnegiea gigantea]